MSRPPKFTDGRELSREERLAQSKAALDLYAPPKKPEIEPPPIKIVVFDTETNGLPKNYKTPAGEDPENWPNICQLAYATLDLLPDGSLKKTGFESIVFRPDWEEEDHDEGAEAVHGWSYERLKKEGQIWEEGIRPFNRAWQGADIIVAHNLNFDDNVFEANCLKRGTEYHVKPGFCTMEYLTDLVKLPQRSGWGGYKWPKLQEAWDWVFKKYGDRFKMKSFEESFNAHDAGEDTRAAANLLFILHTVDLVDLKSFV